MAGYTTPSWTNDAAPAIDASALTALGRAVETAEHPYGVCSTAAGTAAKTVTIDVSGTLSLFTGLTVRVKFSNANTASAPTLNVNGTGAKPIVAFGTTGVANVWAAGDVVNCTYDGTSWIAHSSRIVTLTTAQYEALSDAEKQADILYCLIDDDSGADVYSKSQVDALLNQKQAVINTTGILKGNGNGTVVAATVDSAPNASHTSNLISSAAVANTGIGVAGSTLTAISDANSAVLTGFYSTTSSTANLPSDLTTTAEKNCMIFTVAKGDYVHQQLYCFDQKRIFYRYRSASQTWTAWMSSDCNYYNADTNMGDESARKAAIQALYSQMGGLNGSLQRTMAYGVIRYTNGYYVPYLFFGRFASNAVETVVEILKSNPYGIAVWTINNSTATKSYMLPKKTKIYEESGENITATANTFTYTGLSVTIPASSYYALYGSANYVGQPGTGAAFSTSNSIAPGDTTGSNVYRVRSYSDHSMSTSICGYAPTALTLYLWCRWAGGATNNKANITGWYEPA